MKGREKRGQQGLKKGQRRHEGKKKHGEQVAHASSSRSSFVSYSAALGMGNESSVLRSSGWKEPARTTDRCRRSNVVSWCTGSTNRVLFRDHPLGILQTRDSAAPLSLAIFRIFLFLFFYLESEMKCLLENKNLTKLQTLSCYLTVLSFDHDVILLQLFYKQRHYDRSRFLVSI